MALSDIEQTAETQNQLCTYESKVSLHWENFRLDDICSLRSEIVTPSKSADSKYIGLEHIDSGNPQLSRWGLASEVQSAKNRFYTNDVLYGKLRPYLDKAVQARFDGICSTDILVLSTKELADGRFLSYLLHTKDFIQFAMQTTKGVNHPRTSWASIAQFKVSLPPLPEQRAIAHVLQSVQEAIQARRKELELERERKAALMQHLFTYGTRGETTKQTEIGEIPESWEVLRVGNIVTLQRGYDITRKQQKPGKIPVISSSGVLSYHDTAMVNGPGVIIGRKGSLGTVFYSESDFWPHDTTLWVKDFFGNNPKFIYYFLQTLRVSHLDVGSSNPTLNRNHVHTIQAGLPGFIEQSEIAEILSACDSKIAALEKEVALYGELFRALLDELMTGKLSAHPPVE